MFSRDYFVYVDVCKKDEFFIRRADNLIRVTNSI